MRVLVTGGAGFIGSHLVDRLLAEGHEVRVLDNLSSGRLEFLRAHEDDPRFEFVQGDLLDLAAVTDAMEGREFVWHLAANPDVRAGAEQTGLDLEQSVVATYHVLEAMRRGGARGFAYASSSTVYGETAVFPTPESYGPPLPISLYGAGKLAGEAYASAFAGLFGIKVWIFRFANVIGPRGTHGVLVDFAAKLRKDPSRLEILGDGKQCKSYLLVDELIDGMQHAIRHAPGPVSVFNLGSGDNVEVKRIAEIVVERLGLQGVRFDYTGGVRGWPGDVPRMLLDTSEIERLGWKAKRSSEDAVREAIDAIVAERW